MKKQRFSLRNFILATSITGAFLGGLGMFSNYYFRNEGPRVLLDRTINGERIRLEEFNGQKSLYVTHTQNPNVTSKYVDSGNDEIFDNYSISVGVPHSSDSASRTSELMTSYESQYKKQYIYKNYLDKIKQAQSQ